jgi:hypothetical protein
MPSNTIVWLLAVFAIVVLALIILKVAGVVV